MNGAEDIIQDGEYDTELDSAAITKTKETASAPAAATAASSLAPAPSNESKSTEDENAGVETPDTELPIPATTEDSPVVSSAEEIIPISPLVNGDGVAAQKTENVATAPQSITPSAEIINELECAKCRILTPAQAKLST